MAKYTVTKLAESYIDPTGSSYFESLTVKNVTNKTVYMMKPDGEVVSLPPLHSTTDSDSLDVGIEIQALQRSGKDTGDEYPYIDLSRKVSYPLIKVNVSSKTLMRDAVYVSELGLAFAYGHLKHLLPNVHRLGDQYTRDAIIHAQEKFIVDGSTVPLIISANSHNPDINFFYIAVNNVITSVNVTHDGARPEGVLVTFNLSTSSSRWTIPVDLTDPVSTVCELGTKWIMGHDREKVIEAISAEQQKSLNKVTLAEVENKISESTKNISEQLTSVTRERDQLQQQLLLQKKDLDNVTQELRQANAPAEQSAEQFLAQQKTLTAQYTRDVTVAKLNDDRDRSQIEFNQKMMYNQQAHENNMQLGELKVQKEQCSVSSANVTATGNVVKTAAVVAPIIGSLGYFLYTAAKCATGGLIGAISSLAPALAKSGIVPSMSTLLTKVASTGKTVCRSVYNTVTKGASWVADKVASGVHWAVDKAASFASSVGSAIGSVVDWLFD